MLRVKDRWEMWRDFRDSLVGPEVWLKWERDTDVRCRQCGKGGPFGNACLAWLRVPDMEGFVFCPEAGCLGDLTDMEATR